MMSFIAFVRYVPLGDLIKYQASEGGPLTELLRVHVVYDEPINGIICSDFADVVVTSTRSRARVFEQKSCLPSAYC